MGCKGKGPTSKRQKASRPARHRTPSCSPVPAKTAPVAAAPTPPPTADLPKGLMRPESAASLLATPRRQKLLEHIWQRTSLTQAIRHTVPRAPGTLRRAGPGLPGLRGASSCLPGRHARPRPRNRRLQPETAPVPSAAHRCQPRGPGGAVRGLDRRRRLRGTTARHRQDRCRSARRTRRRQHLASLARAAAPAVPLPLS